MPDDDWTNAEMRTTYEWWDQAEQLHVDYDAQAHTGGAYPYESHFTRDANGHLTHVEIDDGRPRDVDFITDADGRVLQRHEDEEGTAPSTEDGDPMELHYYFNGIAVGDVGNNGTSDIDYAASIAEHTRTPGAGPFMGGRTNSQNVRYADFDQSYDPINGLTYESTASRYTVQSGDTLESIAYLVWGDASYWYVLADSNGLTGGETLIAGQNLIVPNKVHNAHNSSDTYRVYDPNEAIGDTSPTAPKPAKKAHGGCGGFGQILVAIISVAVAMVLPAISPFFGTFLGGMVGAAIGSAVGQGAGLALGIQSKFDWGAVAMAAISAGVSQGMNGVISGTDLLSSFARGALGSAITQGIAVATGLQKKFDWAAVAAAGVSSAVTSAVANSMGMGKAMSSGKIGGFTAAMHTGIPGMAGMIANAATRTLINGSDFGDNILAALPDVLGQTIGGAMADAVAKTQGIGSSANSLAGLDAGLIASGPQGGQRYDNKAAYDSDPQSAERRQSAMDAFVREHNGEFVRDDVLQYPDGSFAVYDASGKNIVPLAAGKRGEDGRPIQEVFSHADPTGHGDIWLFRKDTQGNPERLPDRPVLEKVYKVTDPSHPERPMRIVYIAPGVYEASVSNNPSLPGHVSENRFFTTRARMNDYIFASTNHDNGWHENYAYTNTDGDPMETTIFANAANPGWDTEVSHKGDVIQHITVVGVVKNFYGYNGKVYGIDMKASRILELTWHHEIGHAFMGFTSEGGGEQEADRYALKAMGLWPGD